MNRISTLVVIITTVLLSSTLQAQYNAGLPANFGIDGDVLSGQSQNISGSSSQGSFDWFKKPGSGPNVGIGVIDTSGKYINEPLIAAGQNIQFTRGMAFPRYSVQNGYLVMDARYIRDHFGTSNAPGKSDFTTFTSGSKNGDIPSTWATTPGGSTIADKADIIDAYAHMRRNGTVINNTNPSALILAMGVSTLGNTGNRFVDFELFRSRIDYNSTTGLFTNSGPVVTGGHTAWDFNLDGSIKDIGDMSVSFSFGTSGVSDMGVYIWVSQLAYNTITPLRFKFVTNEFYGSTYGYARIVPVSSTAFGAWGSVNSDNTLGPAWGTNSKSLGSSPANYYSSDYGTNDFAEAALDLTSLGVDPALSVGIDPCTPPYTRIMAKTRSSLSFTSSLQDFIGPAEFLDAPQAPAQIVNPGPLKCNQTSLTLSPSLIVSGAVYNWSTSNGNIVSNPLASSITINKAGKYYLTSSIVSGCPSNKDSVIISSDFYQPIATATSIGLINPANPLSTADIKGGDVAASNFATPYGGSAGLNYDWSGPNNYTSTSRNNTVNKIGTYTLVLTEQRNGCKDTAETAVLSISSTLPVKIDEFSAVKKAENLVNLKWKTLDQNPHKVEVQRSENGNIFRTVYIYNNENFVNIAERKSYDDDISGINAKKIFYRLKITEQGGVIVYSNILSVNFGGTSHNGLHLSPNPAYSYTVLTYKSNRETNAEIQVVNMSGKILRRLDASLSKGLNQIMVSDMDHLQKGIYLIRMTTGDKIINKKFIKQ